jgi:hypothetical protein
MLEIVAASCSPGSRYIDVDQCGPHGAFLEFLGCEPADVFEMAVAGSYLGSSPYVARKA